jgi:ABC-type phosphate transport system substrate-binding protein
MSKSWTPAATVLLAVSLGGIVGCGGGGSDRITRVSRQNNSGTYAYFREALLGEDGKFKLGSVDQSGSKDVVELVSKTPSAIGYSGMGYATDDVKMLKISPKKGEPAIAPTVENAKSGAYPLSRPLYIYTLGEPTGAAKTLVDWIVSTEGQQIVEDEGFVPYADDLPEPPQAPAPAGTINMEGSDTMVQIAGAWAAAFMKNNPEVKIIVQGGGSGRGIASLINGTTDLAIASREMEADEKQTAAEKHGGREVQEFVVGKDALGVYVHKDNPLDEISIEELAGIYGDGGTIVNWSQLTPAGAESGSGE